MRRPFCDRSKICGRPFIFPNDIALIALAVLEILLRIAGIVAVAYVVFGGGQAAAASARR